MKAFQRNHNTIIIHNRLNKDCILLLLILLLDYLLLLLIVILITITLLLLSITIIPCLHVCIHSYTYMYIPSVLITCTIHKHHSCRSEIFSCILFYCFTPVTITLCILFISYSIVSHHNLL